MAESGVQQDAGAASFRERTASPYYVLVSVLFAVILTVVGAWVAKTIDGYLGPGLRTVSDITVQRGGGTLALVDLPVQDAGGKTRLGDVSVVWGDRPVRLSDVPLHGAKVSWQVRGDWMLCLAHIALAFAVFFYVIHLWLYFSRILVHIKESPTGEVLSFVLGFIVLLAVGAFPLAPSLWPLILGVCTFFVGVKSLQVTLSLPRGHPLREIFSKGWAWAFVYAASLCVLQFLVASPSVAPTTEAGEGRGPAFLLISVAVLLGFSAKVFGQYRGLEATVDKAMRAHYGEGTGPQEGGGG